jgi:NAD(P)-dependent dehydrogenase (short-subunit alcohol dehydrogenase family)
MQKPYIVMGARGGIGEALALRLLRAGHPVIATMRETGSASAPLRSHGADIRALDVCESKSIPNVFAEFSEGSPVAGLAYCIGSIDLMPLKTAKEENFLNAFDVNVMGAVRVLKFLEKSLKSGLGSVVLFSSIAVQQGFANHTVISSAKGAVEGLTKALAAEWAGSVRVNCIAPSLTDTALASRLTSSSAMREAIEKMHPISRLGTSEDSASLAEFLLSDQSSWISGQIFHVDGGRSTLRTKG